MALLTQTDLVRREAYVHIMGLAVENARNLRKTET